MAKSAAQAETPVKTRIRRGDTVMVRKGKDAGQQGKVVRVLKDKNAVLVQGLNYVKRHTKPNPQAGRQGGIMEKEGPIRIPNVSVVCPACEQPTKAGREKMEDGTWARKCRKCGQNF